MSKRILAILLSSLMVLSAMPTAFAEEAETNSETESSVAEEVVDEEPTPEPIVEPTAEPTIVPTVEPTVDPTAEPTVEPTTTPEPTEEPKESEVVASGTCGDNLTWTLDSDGLLTISGTGAINSSAFDSDENEISKNIISVVIEDGVTSIGRYAFYSCSSLTSVTIPDGVTSIGYEAFYGCSSLTSVTIPDGVTSIGDNAFEYCSSLTDLTISCNTINNLGDYCFYDTAIKDVYFHGTKAEWETVDWDYVAEYDSVEPTIHYDENHKTHIFTSGTCGDNLTWTLDSDGLLTISGTGAINSSAFDPDENEISKNIISVVIEDGVTSIGRFAFYSCSNLISVTIPDSVTSIGNYTFFGCSSLTSVTIPDSVTSIGSYAFYGCSNLTDLTISCNTINNLGTSCFYDTAIKDVYFHGTKAEWETVDWDYVAEYDSVEPTIHYDENHKTHIFTSGTCGDNLTWTLDSDGLLTISGTGKMADYDDYTPWDSCRHSIKSVIIEDGVTSIGSCAFYKCSNLTDLTISCNTINNLGTSCFYDTAIKDVYFHGTKAEWETVDWDYVAGYDSVEPTIHCDENHKTYIITSGTCGDNLTWTLDSDGLLTISGNGAINSSEFDSDENGISENIISVVIEEGVTSIGDRAFEYCSSLTSVTIPDGVTSIGDYAFKYCRSLTDLTISCNTINNLGDDCFYGTAIKDVYFHGNKIEWSGVYWNNVAEYDSVEPTIHYDENHKTHIFTSGTCGDNLTWTLDSDGLLTISGSGKMADYDYDYTPWRSYKHSIKSVIIEDGVTSIGSYAFNGCSSLTSVTIPDGVTSIGSDAFCGCRSLTSVIIPDSVISIGGAFEGCTGLKTVTVGEGVASGEIKLYYAFGGSACEASFKLVISDGIFKIGNNAFESCQFITSVTIPDSVKTIGDSAFEYCSNLTNVKIPNSVKTIGDRAFYSCGWEAGGIGNLTIPDSVTKIGDEAFSCGITALLLPAKLPKISERAFGYYGGYYPTTIYYKGSAKQWESVKKSLPNYSDYYRSNGTYKKRSIICNATHIHEYSTTKVTKATLNSNGKKYWKCKYCSKTKTSTVYKVASVKISDTAYLYNGSCKTPGVTVKNTKGTTLKKNTDYTVTYASGRREIGTYKVTVKFKGNYSGTKEFTFKIVPKGTSLSSVSASSKAFTAKWNLQKTQTSGYQIEYSTSSKFSSGNVYKTITKNTSSSLKVSGLKAKTKYYVRVRTYKLVNGTKVYSSWSSAKSVTTK